MEALDDELPNEPGAVVHKYVHRHRSVPIITEDTEPDDDAKAPPRPRSYGPARRRAPRARRRFHPARHNEAEEADDDEDEDDAKGAAGPEFKRGPLPGFEWTFPEHADEDATEFCYLCHVSADSRNYYQATLQKIMRMREDMEKRTACELVYEFYERTIRAPTRHLPDPLPEWKVRTIYRHAMYHAADMEQILLNDIAVCNAYDIMYQRTAQLSVVQADGTSQPLPPSERDTRMHLAVIGTRLRAMKEYRALQGRMGGSV